MRISGHIAGGVLVTGAALAIIQPPEEVADRLLLLGAVGGSLPDWDYLIYALKKGSFEAGEDFRHHTWITHTFPFYLLPAIIIYLLGRFWQQPAAQWGAIIFALSTATHLVQDLYRTGDGIMLFYPFSRRMYGIALTHTHGKEWLQDYYKSNAYKVELFFIGAAAVYVTGYAIFRVSDWLQFGLNLVRVGYIVFLLYLLSVVGLFVLHGILQLLGRLGFVELLEPGRVRFVSAGLLDKSIALNGGLVFLSICIPIVVLAAVFVPSSTKLAILPMIISPISFVWGARQTGLGSIAGSPSTAIGLILFAALEPSIGWWAYSPIFFVINLVGHTSGWLGGFTNFGQIREASCFSYFRIRLGDGGHTVPQLVSEIQQSISDVFEKRWSRIRFTDVSKGEVILAERDTDAGTSGSIITTRKELEWARGSRPQVAAVKWLLERPLQQRTLDTILDQVFNVWRNLTTRAVIHADNVDSNTPNTLEVIVMTFRETSSILWVDSEVTSFATSIHQRLLEQLHDSSTSEYVVKDSQFFHLRSWKEKPKLEQYAKQTWAAQRTGLQSLEKMRLETEGGIPKSVIDEFVGSKTFFDRWRGRATSLVTFLISQVILAILIELLVGWTR